MSYDMDCYCDDPRIPVCLWPDSAGHRGSPCQYCDRVREDQDKPWPIPTMCVFCEIGTNARLDALGEAMAIVGALCESFDRGGDHRDVERAEARGHTVEEGTWYPGCAL